MTKQSSKKKVTVTAPEVKNTTSLRLEVPNELYFSIKGKADKYKLQHGTKKNIHDQAIDDLYSANSSVKKPKA